MLGKILMADLGFVDSILCDDVEADLHTLVADIDSRSGDQFLDFVLALAAEATPQDVSFTLGHGSLRASFYTT